MLSAFGAALALAYAAIPSLPAAIVALAAVLHVPTLALTRRVPPVVLTVVQLPVSIAMFTLLRRLATGHYGAIPTTSKLAAALRTGHALHVGGVDLATTGLAAIAAGPWSIAAAVVVGLGAALVLASRRPGAESPVLFTLLPATTALFLPLAVTVFIAATSILRAASGRLLT